jgi:hypothetical protein
MARAKPTRASAPELLFHGTDAEIEGPVRPFTHFGTYRAALQRAAQTVHRQARRHDGTGWNTDLDSPVIIHPARVGIAAAMRVPDMQGVLKNHSPTMLADLLFYDARKAIDADERSLVLSAVSRGEDAYGVLAGILWSRGCDGLVYRNAFEDVGNDSWVVLDGGQAELGEPIRMSLAEAMAALEAGVAEPPVEHEPGLDAGAPSIR